MLIIGLILIVLMILILLYIFCLKGRTNMQEIEFLRNFDYAHRGLHDKMNPENSLGAFKEAIKNGYGAELDVHLLKDGNIAVIHDSPLARTTGQKGIIENLTLSDLSKYTLEGTAYTIPSFEEVLELFENKTPLIIELKTYKGNHKELCKAVCDKLTSYKGNYCIESFDPRCLMWLKKNQPQIIRGQLSQNFIKSGAGFDFLLNFLLTSLSLNFLTKPDFIAYKFADRHNIPNRICLKFWKIAGASWTLRNIDDYNIAQKENLITIFENFKPKNKG